MNLSREIFLLRQVCAPVLFNPTQISVRFAKPKEKKNKFNYELTNMALWRKERGLDTNPNKFGPLTNLPDYSYLDGRPVPLGINLKARLEKQREYAERITLLSAELDFARERYQSMKAEQQESKQRIVGSKLKRKGQALRNNSDSSSK